MAETSDGAGMVHTLTEFCKTAKISKRMFYTLVERGEAPATVRIGRQRLVRQETAVAWLQSREAA